MFVLKTLIPFSESESHDHFDNLAQIAGQMVQHRLSDNENFLTQKIVIVGEVAQSMINPQSENLTAQIDLLSVSHEPITFSKSDWLVAYRRMIPHKGNDLTMMQATRQST